MKKYRAVILIAAVLIFLCFNLATFWWVNSFESLGAAITLTWKAIIGNWMILIIIGDSVVFLLLIFVWLVRDARQRGWIGYKRWGWIVAILTLGSPALLVYLISRPDKLQGS